MKSWDSPLDPELQRLWDESAARIKANPSADGWLRLIELLRKAANDKRIVSSPGAMGFLELMLELAADALTASTAKAAVQPLIDVSDEAIFAKPFLKHAGRARKPGAIRGFIRATLKKAPSLTNEELWAAIKKRAPKGWKPMESPRLGRYIEGPKPDDEVKWKSFCTYAGDERKRLKIHD